MLRAGLFFLRRRLNSHPTPFRHTATMTSTAADTPAPQQQALAPPQVLTRESLLQGSSSEAEMRIWKWQRALRRYLHQNPELSWQEQNTSRVICEHLGALGLKPHRLATHGVYVDITGSEFMRTEDCADKGQSEVVEQHGKKSTTKRKVSKAEAVSLERKRWGLIGVRADIDALPIHEATGLPFASRNAGIMHACGHDGHTTIALGALALLMKRALRGEIKAMPPTRFFFQPAEEVASGAKKMIEDGVLDGVDCVFGGHIDRGYPVNTLIVDPGCVNASTDTFEIVLEGKGCHGARPHEGVDAIVMGSQVVSQLQTLVSRTTDPAFPAVVTVGKFHAGTAFNIVAARATLTGTLRTIHNGTRSALKEGVVRVAEGVAHSMGGKATVSFTDGVPPVINTAALEPIVRAAAKTALAETSPLLGKPDADGGDDADADADAYADGGDDADDGCLANPHVVVPLPKANMGAEDFAYYLAQTDGFFIRYGAGFAGEKGKRVISAHNREWDFNEHALQIGARYLAQVVTEYHLNRQHGNQCHDNQQELS